jgi:hypothetical protein
VRGNSQAQFLEQSRPATRSVGRRIGALVFAGRAVGSCAVCGRQSKKRNGSHGKADVTIGPPPSHRDYGATPSTINIRPFTAACLIGLIAA